MSGQRKVLVTGASGFVGRHVLAPLLERGYEVHVATFGPSSEPVPGVIEHSCDLLARDGAASLIESVRPTHLLHMAWFVTHGQFWAAEQNLQWVSASLDLLRHFVAAGGKRAVISGTCAEYEWTARTMCVEERTPLRPATLYGVAKDALRRVATAYCASKSCSLAWGRIFFLYGPHEAPGRLIPSVVRSLLANEPALCSHGEQVRDFMHVSDVARAFAALLDSRVEGAVNIASGQPVKLRDVVLSLGKELGKVDLVKLGALPAQANDPQEILADISRLSRDVRFSPRISLEDGLRQSIDWWRSAAGTATQR